MSNSASTSLQNPAIAGLIVSHSRSFDLISLIYTNKSFSAIAERALYRSLVFSNPQTAYRACLTLLDAPRLAAYVHTLVLTPRRSASPLANLPRHFWETIHDVLTKLPNLQSLVFPDPYGGDASPLAGATSFSWVFPLEVPFSLRDAQIMFPYDARIAAFVARQRKLRTLHTAEVASSLTRENLLPGDHSQDVDGQESPAFPDLRVFDGPMAIASQLLTSPLTHMQTFQHNESDLVTFIPKLRCLRKSLRSLSLHYVPENRVAETVGHIGRYCPDIRHIGVLSLPATQRTELHSQLTSFAVLESLEVDLTRGWVPQPTPPLQRVLASELRIYCPTLRVFMVWYGSHHFVWKLEDDEGQGKWRLSQEGSDVGWETV